MERYLRLSLRHNFSVNVLDGGFFGLAVGLASFVTVIPLFVSQFTDSAVLIGLIPAIHAAGWQLPQLLTADHVARASRYLPMTLGLTIIERVAFVGLAVIALAMPVLSKEVALTLTFAMLVVEGLGAGLAAAPWQSLIAKIIPPDQRGTFFGTQAAASNLLASLGAVVAGLILEQFGLPINFALCFSLASAAMVASWIAFAWTREPAFPSTPRVKVGGSPGRLGLILRRDVNFRWFLIVRGLFALATMACGFYTVYAVRQHNASVVAVSLMTSVYMAGQIVANPIMGWIGDRSSHRAVMQVGALAAVGSALLAAWAPASEWFYVVFVLAGVSNVSAWTITMTMTIDFAPNASERPVYVGLANTLVAPAWIFAPLLGGWLADTAGYPGTFVVSAASGALAWLILRALVRDPKAAYIPRSLHESPS